MGNYLGLDRIDVDKLKGKRRETYERVLRGEMFTCPTCNKPLEFGVDRCPNCHAFLDPESGKWRTDISDEEISQTVQEANEKNKTGLTIAIVGFVVAALGAFTVFGGLLAGYVPLIIGFVLVFVGLFRVEDAQTSTKVLFSQTIIPEVLNQVFDEAQHTPKSSIPGSVIRATDMRFPFDMGRVDNITGSDLINATYKGVGVQMSDVTMVETTQVLVSDDDGNSHLEDEKEEVFRGQWIICDFYKRLSADLIVYEKNSMARAQIQTESEAFNRHYGIACASEHDAFYILTPHMMEAIEAMDARAGGDTYLHFTKDGKVHLAVNSGKDLFEVTSFKEDDVDALRKKYLDEITYITDLIDALKLVDTLYE